MFDQVPDMAAKRAELTPNKIAFETRGRNWTFEQVNKAASSVAAGLTQLGLKRGDRLAILSLNRIDFFISLFACQKTGIILAPLNWRQPAAELIEVLGSVGAKAVMFDSENSQTARVLAEGMSLTSIAMDYAEDGEVSFESLLKSDSDQWRNVVVEASEPWYLLFTSGTTGLPKAVIQTARMCWANALNIAQANDLSSQDKGVNYLPLFHTGGINVYTLPIFLFGGSSTIVSRFEQDHILQLIQDRKVTLFFGVPAIFQSFSLHEKVDDVDWSNVRMGCGGAPLSEAIIEFFSQRGAVICNGFGMTESGPTGLLMERARASEKIGSVGRPQMLTELRLDGVPDGEPGEGEIWLRGPTVTPGYYNNPAATYKSFTKDGWLKSGDIGRRDGEGFIYIVDRIKDMYISGGENVYPAEVERVLHRHPDILEAAVIGVEDEKWGEVGAAFIMLRPGRTLDTGLLTQLCRERLASYKVPKSFHIIEDFPRTAAGKIRKPQLREILGRGQTSREKEAGEIVV